MSDEKWDRNREKDFHKLSTQALAEYDQVIAMLDEVLNEQLDLKEDAQSMEDLETAMLTAKHLMFDVLLYGDCELLKEMLKADRKLIEKDVKDSGK